MAHIGRHQVIPEEVEEVCHGDPMVEQGYAGRLRIVGPTQSKRMLAVILAPEGSGIYYPVTADRQAGKSVGDTKNGEVVKDDDRQRRRKGKSHPKL